MVIDTCSSVGTANFIGWNSYWCVSPQIHAERPLLKDESVLKRGSECRRDYQGRSRVRSEARENVLCPTTELNIFTMIGNDEFLECTNALKLQIKQVVD